MRSLLLPLVLLAFVGCDTQAQPEPADSTLTPGDTTAWTRPTLYVEGSPGYIVLNYDHGSGYAFAPRPGSAGATTLFFSGDLPGLLSAAGADGTRWRMELPTDPGPSGEAVGTCVMEDGMAATEWPCAYRWLSPPAPPAGAFQTRQADS